MCSLSSTQAAPKLDFSLYYFLSDLQKSTFTFILPNLECTFTFNTQLGLHCHVIFFSIFLLNSDCIRTRSLVRWSGWQSSVQTGVLFQRQQRTNTNTNTQTKDKYKHKDIDKNKLAEAIHQLQPSQGTWLDHLGNKVVRLIVTKVASSSISHAFLPFLPPLKKKPTSGLSFIQKEVSKAYDTL